MGCQFNAEPYNWKRQSIFMPVGRETIYKNEEKGVWDITVN